MPSPTPDYETTDPESIQALVETSQVETDQLEYKSQVVFGKRGKKDERSTLERILSTVVAFSNAQGGTILIGISEENGVPVEIVGIAPEDIDELSRALTQVIHSKTIPRIVDYRIQTVVVQEKTVLALVVPPGLWRPYGIIKDNEGSYRFVRRASGQSVPMGWSEVRNMILDSDGRLQRIGNWMRSEVKSVQNRDSGTSAVFLAHPLRPEFDSVKLTPQDFLDTTSHLLTLAGTRGRSSINMDGLLVHDMKQLHKRKGGNYFQINWDCSLIAVSRHISTGEGNAKQYIDAHSFYTHIDQIRAYEEWLRTHSQQTQFVYSLAFINVYGYRISIPPDYAQIDPEQYVIDRETVHTQPWIVDIANGSFESRIMPGYESLWYSAGHSKAYLNVNH